MNLTPLASILSIALLFILFFWLYCDYQIDAFRQKLFALRDEFFDQAANGHIPFDDPAYTMLRRTMNGLIRFAHQVNLMQLMLLFFVSKYKKIQPDFLSRLQNHSASLNADQQRLVNDHLDSMNRLVARQLILSSPITCLIIGMLLVPSMVMLNTGKHLDSAKTSTIERLDALALSEGNH